MIYRVVFMDDLGHHREVNVRAKDMKEARSIAANLGKAILSCERVFIMSITPAYVYVYTGWGMNEFAVLDLSKMVEQTYGSII